MISSARTIDSPNAVTITTAHESSRSSIWPGLLLTATIAGAAFFLRTLPAISAFSPMIIAIVLGMALNNIVGTPVQAKAGVAVSLRKVLRTGIVLLGLQLTAAQVAEVGVAGIAIIAASLVATFLFTTWLGRVLGVDRKLSELIAAGSSICGASAIVATNTVTRASDEDVAYAMACITLFGSVAMFGYPLLPQLLHLNPHDYGLWSGASIHEVAQAVAAAFQGGEQAGQFGTISKLTRVMMLAPVIVVLSLIATRRAMRQGSDEQTQGKAPFPWFVLGFVALVGINSVIHIPAEIKTYIVLLTSFLLAMALAAMGLETNIAKLRAKGIRPLLLALAAFIFIASFSLLLVKMSV